VGCTPGGLLQPLAKVAAAVSAKRRRRAATRITRLVTVAGKWVIPLVWETTHLDSGNRRAGGRPALCPVCYPPLGATEEVKRNVCLATNPPPYSRRLARVDLEEQRRWTSDL